jgi:hypothetical protein
VALSCLRAGFRYLGDDWIGLDELSGGSLVGHSLYSTARLDPRQLARFPLLADTAVETDDPFDDKWLIPLLDVFPERLESAAEIRALALPRVVDADRSRICPASRSEALLRLAPSSLLMFLSPAASGLERMARLVQQVPSYWLELGRDVSTIPARVDELLAEATSS